MKRLARPLFLVPFLCLLAPAAEARIADVVCDDHDRMVTRLQRDYGASLQSRGLRGPDAILEVWIVARTGDWTLVQSYANGQSCIVAMGEGWETLAPASDPA